MKTSALFFSVLLAAAAVGLAAEPKPSAKSSDTPSSLGTATPGGPKLSYTVFHINANAIALTFDDGPHVKNTPRLLEMLKERGIKATFFLIGRNVVNFPEVARRVADDGHE